MYRLIELLLLALIVVAPTIALANPTFIVVYNQEDETITESCVILFDNRTAEMYNSTHAKIESSSTVLVRIYVRNVLVYSFLAEPNKLYRVKVKVGKLILKLPKNVKAYVTILASGETIEVNSFESDVVEIDNVPYGLIKVRVVGAITDERVFNYQGGVIEVKEHAYIKWSEFLPWLGISLIPLCTYTAYSLAKKRIKKPKSRVEAKLLQRPTRLEKRVVEKPKEARAKVKLPEVEEAEEVVVSEEKPLKKGEKKVKKKVKRKFLSIADILEKLEED